MAEEGADGSVRDPAPGGGTTSREAIILSLRLIGGDVRHVALGTRTGSVGNALDRLEDWIETNEGSWVHKRWIVEAAVEHDSSP